MKTKLHFFFILTILSTTLIFGQTQKGKYSITFNSVWNAVDHGTLPGNAHWSKLVGATHKTSGAILEMGQKATIGIKDVAERGNNTAFNTEVNSAITNKEADQYINGNNLSTAIGNIIINDLIVDKEYSLLTLVSMIAPSPDWMIAINSIALLDENNTWKPSVVIDLFPYDAGTDSGSSYTSANAITDPIENISNLNNVAPFNDQKIGTITITLLETLSVSNTTLKNELNVYYNSNTKNIVFSNHDDIKISKIEVYNILGKQVKTETNTTASLSINSIPSGIYVVKILTNKGFITKKIIKQ